MANMRRLLIAGLGATLLFTPLTPAWGQCEGETVKPGTRLDATTIDKVASMCLDGKKVGDMIPHERWEWAIREQRYPMVLIPNDIPEELNLPYRLIEATKTYSADVKLEKPSLNLVNYKAGVPFPNIDPNDPDAPVKIIWNYKYGRPKGDQFGSPGISTEPNFVFTLVDGVTGDIRIQRWNFSRFYLVGRVTGGPPVLGDGIIYSRHLLFAVTPHDIKGVGTFTIAYTDGKLDDTWAYIRSVRRVRRLSGGAWVDPIGGTDELQDDIGFNAHPAWYDSYKLLGKKWVLHVTDSQRHIGPKNTRAAWQYGKTTLADEFPRLQSGEAPYWNMLDLWMPRLAWVVEAIPPHYHPYGKRIIYFDALNHNFLHQVVFDKKGDFWKIASFAAREYDTHDGVVDPRTGKPEIWIFEAWGQFIDFQRRHATHFHVAEDFRINTAGTKSEDFTLATLEAAGR